MDAWGPYQEFLSRRRRPPHHHLLLLLLLIQASKNICGQVDWFIQSPRKHFHKKKKLYSPIQIKQGEIAT